MRNDEILNPGETYAPERKEHGKLAINTRKLRNRSEFFGVWISDRGSRYLCDGKSFVCISVHHAQFIGWVGKIAVKIMQPVDKDSTGLQAICFMQSGELSHWVPVSISIRGDIVTKCFLPNIPAGILINGCVEQYRRVQLEE